MGHFFAVDCMIWWVTTTLTHWGQVYIDYGKGLLLVRFQAITWNWYCHINEIRTQWVEDHSIHCMYIYSWNWFLIVLNTAIKDFELNWNWSFERSFIKVTRDKKSPILTRILSVCGLWLQFEFTHGFEMMHEAWRSREEVPYCFSMSSVKLQGHTGWKIDDLNPI